MPLLFLVELFALKCTLSDASMFSRLSLDQHQVFSILSVRFSSVPQPCLTLCDPVDRSAPSFPVHHRLPELVQTHVHRVWDAIQPSHPLSSPSPPAFNL